VHVHRGRSRIQLPLTLEYVLLERGGLPANELDDWLQAERELECAAPPIAQGFSKKAEL